MAQLDNDLYKRIVIENLLRHAEAEVTKRLVRSLDRTFEHLNFVICYPLRNLARSPQLIEVAVQLKPIYSIAHGHFLALPLATIAAPTSTPPALHRATGRPNLSRS